MILNSDSQFQEEINDSQFYFLNLNSNFREDKISEIVVIGQENPKQIGHFHLAILSRD